MYFLKIFLLLSFIPIMLPGQTRENKKDSTMFILQQITVSATRFPEEILKVPYAVSIINNFELKNTRGYGLDEVLSNIPGVLAQSRAGGQDVRLVIRGFGARGAGDRSNSGTSRGIRVMIDGFPETEPDGRTSFDNIDLNLSSEIEVVRSNASALWGNAAGGVISISSMPYFNNSFFNIDGFTGSFGFQKLNLQTGTNIGQGKLFVGFSKTNYDGWRNHSASTKSVFGITLISNLSEKTEVGVYLTGSSNLFHIPGPLTYAEYTGDPKQANSVYENRDERRYNRLGRIGISLDHFINDNNSVSSKVYVNPKYLQRSERGTFRDFTRYHIGGNLIYRNNVIFNDNLSNTFTIGVDEAYQDGAILFYTLSQDNYRGNTLRDNKREGANNLGAFIQDELLISSKLSVILGARYDNITYYSESFIDPALGLQKKSFERLSPKAGITYKISPHYSIYANLGSGVEVPAGNETDPAGTYGQDTVFLLNPLLEPINSTTYELGTKGIYLPLDNLLIKYLTYDVAIYYIDVVNDIIPYRGGRFYFTAGKTNRTGIEIGTSVNLKYGFTISGSLTYSMNKYKSYTIDSAHYSNPGKFADYKNNKVAGIPDFFYNAGINYAPEFLNSVFININSSGMSKYFVDDANTIEVPDFNIINASIGLNKPLPILNGYSLRGFISVNNIFNKKYVASAFINPDVINGEPVYLEPGLPQNVTISLSFLF